MQGGLSTMYLLRSFWLFTESRNLVCRQEEKLSKLSKATKKPLPHLYPVFTLSIFPNLLPFCHPNIIKEFSSFLPSTFHRLSFDFLPLLSPSTASSTFFLVCHKYSYQQLTSICYLYQYLHQKRTEKHIENYFLRVFC
jgi:hypothetical protein